MEKEDNDPGYSNRKAFSISLTLIRAGVEKMLAYLQGRPEKGGLDLDTIRNINQGPAREIKKALMDLQELIGIQDPMTASSAALSVRIGVHGGSCEYSANKEQLYKLETIKETQEIEKAASPDSVCISVVEKVMLDEFISVHFPPVGTKKNGPFKYSLKLE